MTFDTLCAAHRRRCVRELRVRRIRLAAIRFLASVMLLEALAAILLR